MSSKMKLEQEFITGEGLQLVLKEENKDIARLRIYFIYNDLHQQPYALMEDLFVQEEFRGKGQGKALVQAAIEEAKKRKCYKIIATSRYEREKVHKFYQQLGFKDYGKEFRMELW